MHLISLFYYTLFQPFQYLLENLLQIFGDLFLILFSVYLMVIDKHTEDSDWMVTVFESVLVFSILAIACAQIVSNVYWIIHSISTCLKSGAQKA